jgi:predicted transposase YbfD/YdcC
MALALSRPLFLVLQKEFDAVNDPRVERTKLHRLSDILLLSFAAVCCGAEGFEDMQLWAVTYGVENLRRLLGVKLDNGIPHHDTFRRILNRLNPSLLEEQLNTLRQRLPTKKLEHIAIDGKILHGTARDANSPMSLLSVFATELNLVLGQTKIDSKTNEIPVAREILKTISIEGTTVTADALHCQRETALTIREGNAHYLLAVKENQKNLYDAIVSLFDHQREQGSVAEKGSVAMDMFRTVEKNHGRFEVRQGSVIAVRDWLPIDDPLRVWSDWHSVLSLESQRRWKERGVEKTSRFVRYFITSHPGNAETLMGFVRSHWSIENNLHWVMDVTFGEDSSSIATGHAPHNMATLRRLASFLLKSTEPAPSEEMPKALRKMSLRQRRKWAGWNADYLHQVLTNQESA